MDWKRTSDARRSALASGTRNILPNNENHVQTSTRQREGERLSLAKYRILPPKPQYLTQPSRLLLCKTDRRRKTEHWKNSGDDKLKCFSTQSRQKCFDIKTHDSNQRQKNMNLDEKQ